MQQLPFAIFPGFSATASLSLSSDGPIEPRLALRDRLFRDDGK